MRLFQVKKWHASCDEYENVETLEFVSCRVYCLCQGWNKLWGGEGGCPPATFFNKLELILMQLGNAPPPLSDGVTGYSAGEIR